MGSEGRSRYNNNRRGNYNSDRRGHYNSDYKSNSCRSYQKYGNCRFGDSCKYISKSKREELEQEILDLKEKQKNEFPELKSLGIHEASPAPVLKSSCWGNIANSKVLSTEGIEEANKRAKARKAAEEERKKQEHKKVYEQHVESDYDGEDFFDDDESLNEDDFYDDEYDDFDNHDL